MDELCGAQPMGGGACELEAGHVGKHFRSWQNRDDGGFEWDDESQRRLAEKGGRLD